MKKAGFAVLDYTILALCVAAFALGCWGVLRLWQNSSDVWSYLMIAAGLIGLVVLVRIPIQSPTLLLRQPLRIRQTGRVTWADPDRLPEMNNNEPRVKGMQTTLDND